MKLSNIPQASAISRLLIASLLGLAACTRAETQRADTAPGTPTPVSVPVSDPPAANMVVQPTQLSAPPVQSIRPTSVPLASPTPQPQPIVISLPSEPRNLHPFYVHDPAERAVSAAMFVGCISENSHPLQAPGNRVTTFFKTNPVALGCESVPNTADKSVHLEGTGDTSHWVVEFHIRKNWRWTDGKPVTSRDVLYAWHVIMNPELQLRDPLTQKIYSFEALDDHTIRMHFMSAQQARAAAKNELRGSVPFAYFGQLGDYQRYINQKEPLFDEYYWAALRWLPEHAQARTGAAQQRSPDSISTMVGDGAFEIGSWNKGSELILNRSPIPFPAPDGMPNGKAQTLIFKFAGSSALAAAEVALSRSNMALSAPAQEFSTTIDVSAAISFAAPWLYDLVLNSLQAPFDDVLVRQAAFASFRETPVAQSLGLTNSANTAPATATGLTTASTILKNDGWLCESMPCTKVMTQTARGLRISPITKTLEFTLTVPAMASLPASAASTINEVFAGSGFLVHVETLGISGTRSLYGATGIIPNHKFDAVLMKRHLPLSFAEQFSCDRVPSPKNFDFRQTNLSGLCLEPNSEPNLMTETAESITSAEPGHVTEWMAKYESLVVKYAPIIPLGQPIWLMPVRALKGVDFAGFGPETWNAWMWSR